MTEPLQVLGLTGSRHTPSARFRVGQFVGPLAAEGIALDWRPAPVHEYPPAAAWQRPLWLPATLAARLPDIMRSRRADLTLFNREFVSTLATLEGWTGRPRVFDIDDAIWLRRGGGYAARLARQMDVVLCGNAFLAEWFAARAPRVEILPTAVDTGRFAPRPADGPDRVPAFGWSGTSSNHGHLLELEDAFAAVLRARPDVRLRVCSNREPRWRNLPADRVDFVPWSLDAEMPFFHSLDVGLMPLEDTDWTRGKCSYKMLLYLSCGIPCVVSPVGMNNQILAETEAGRPARAPAAWSAAILDLLAAGPADRQALGAAGRRLVCGKYSVDVITRQLAAVLHRAAAGA